MLDLDEDEAETGGEIFFAADELADEAEIEDSLEEDPLQLPSPDHEVDEILAGLIVPRREDSRREIVALDQDLVPATTPSANHLTGSRRDPEIRGGPAYFWRDPIGKRRE